ncbi:uncharacterized protein LOC132632218 [Lycium barbarum]|uniref:uncharacterized protein LOC132632218 n=1 Tax=Lycium barbarum TaxID=112863 RepID=UPI00293F052C|nr:uncharacterized protein LOC132632218 [Lycium barbarum]
MELETKMTKYEPLLDLVKFIDLFDIAANGYSGGLHSCGKVMNYHVIQSQPLTRRSMSPCRFLMVAMGNAAMQHTFQELNKVAHELACFGKEAEEQLIGESIFWDFSPPFLTQLLNNDIIGSLRLELTHVLNVQTISG